MKTLYGYPSEIKKLATDFILKNGSYYSHLDEVIEVPKIGFIAVYIRITGEKKGQKYLLPFFEKTPHGKDFIDLEESCTEFDENQLTDCILHMAVAKKCGDLEAQTYMTYIEKLIA